MAKAAAPIRAMVVPEIAPDGVAEPDELDPTAVEAVTSGVGA